MDGLRWLLLFFGVLVIAGVYLYSRREREKAEEEPAPDRRLAPTLGGDPKPDAEPEPLEEIAEPVDAVEVRPVGKQKIVTLRLIARDGGAFKGDELVLSMRGIGLRHGKFGIFHRYDGNDEERTVFSAASLVEPVVGQNPNLIVVPGTAGEFRPHGFEFRREEVVIDRGGDKLVLQIDQGAVGCIQCGA